MKTKIIKKRILTSLICSHLFLGCNFLCAYGATPIINIDAPNSNGVSITKMQDLQVSQEGLIFNNSKIAVHTKLANQIQKNPNLKNNEASIIVAQITGQKDTGIQGNVEIAGKRAGLVIANPNGIRINNSSFINTSQVTLAAAKPIVEKTRVDKFSVQQGHIQIGTQGINATNSQLTLVGANVTVDGTIQADSIKVLTGVNSTIDSNNSLIATTKHNTTSQAIDVRKTGGMYANSIFLETTTDGQSINNDGVISSKGEVSLNASGDITVNGKLYGDNVKVKATRNVIINHDNAEDIYVPPSSTTSTINNASPEKTSPTTLHIDSKETLPIVNIGTPNSSGISFNYIDGDFNIANKGIVFNNSLKTTGTILAGSIQKNPNFTTNAASIIIGEIHNTKKFTNISAPIEIGGEKASLILANPNGIHIDGTHFINTKRVTFLAGTTEIVPSSDVNMLDEIHMHMAQGQQDITVLGKGVLPDQEGVIDSSQINLVAPKIKIDAPVIGDNINIIGGTSTLQYDNLSFLDSIQSLKEAQPIEITNKGWVEGQGISIYSQNSNIPLIQGGFISADRAIHINMHSNIILAGITRGLNTDIITTGNIDNKGFTQAQITGSFR